MQKAMVKKRRKKRQWKKKKRTSSSKKMMRSKGKGTCIYGNLRNSCLKSNEYKWRSSIVCNLNH